MPRIRRHCQIQPAIKQLPLVLLLMLLPLLPTLADAWQWTDWIAARDYIDEDFYALFSSSSSNTATTTTTTAPLSIEEVADMRVRDIKRRLARQHGYSAQELATMILKKELIEALAFEEEKLRLKIVADVQRMLIQRGIVVAIVAVAIVACWPLIQQAYQVALVNFVVYTDRKKLEAQKCWEFKTKWGLMGVTLMFILDLLQAWLTLSVLLSWVLASASPLRRFLFPTPHIPVRPAQFMGEPMNKAFGGYGINIGSMLVTWALRFAHGKLETWTGYCLKAAMQRQKLRVSKKNTASNNTANPAPPTRRQARRQARQAAAAATAAMNMDMPPHVPPDVPPSWNTTEPNESSREERPPFPTSPAHEKFMSQVATDVKEEEPSALDALD